MDYNKAIESVCFKFGHAVTEYDVFRYDFCTYCPKSLMIFAVLSSSVRSLLSTNNSQKQGSTA